MIDYVDIDTLDKFQTQALQRVRFDFEGHLERLINDFEQNTRLEITGMHFYRNVDGTAGVQLFVPMRVFPE